MYVYVCVCVCTRCANGRCAQRRRTYKWHDHGRRAHEPARLRTARTWEYITLQAYQTLVSVDNFYLGT